MQIYLSGIVAIMIFGLIKTTETGAILFARLTGKKIIVIEGVSSAIKGNVWRSPISVTPLTGQMTAWRYPATQIGKVTLNEDGTGEYCGDVVWKYA